MRVIEEGINFKEKSKKWFIYFFIAVNCLMCGIDTGCLVNDNIDKISVSNHCKHFIFCANHDDTFLFYLVELKSYIVKLSTVVG
jgi:hypothetical protein